MLEIFAYFLIALTGVSFGLIGAGGAIIVVPILVYMLGVPSPKATGYALAISVLVSGVGSFLAFKQKQVHLKQALEFGIPTALVSFFARKVLVPLLPKDIAGLPMGNALMFGFAAVLLTAAVAMIKGQKFQPTEKPHPLTGTALGVGVGIISGIFGIGGGFMIVPILVLFFGISMKDAVGTSLTAVVMITALSFTGEILNNPSMPWGFLLGLMITAASGMVLGSFLRQRVDGAKLKLGFGYFVACVGLAIVGIELYRALA
jgi:uncharacterized protein